jgi:hypothetical protein
LLDAVGEDHGEVDIVDDAHGDHPNFAVRTPEILSFHADFSSSQAKMYMENTAVYT